MQFLNCKTRYPLPYYNIITTIKKVFIDLQLCARDCQGI